MYVVKLLKKGANSFHIVMLFVKQINLLDRADNFLDLLDMSFS